MQTECGDVVLRQKINRIVGGQGSEGREDDRVMADNELRALPTRFFDDGGRDIEGEQDAILRFLRSFNGVKSAEALSRAEEGVYTYYVETAEGRDVRRDLFFALAERDFAVLGMEALGVSVEDIFLRLVQKDGANKTKKEVR